MNYRTHQLQSTAALQKFKKGLIDSISCINLRKQKTHTESFSQQKFGMEQDLNNHHPHRRIVGLSNHEENLPYIVIVKQRNSFPCQSNSIRRSKNSNKELKKRCSQIENVYEMKKYERINNESDQKQLNFICRQKSNKKIRILQKQQFDINNVNMYKRFDFKCQENDEPFLKAKSLLRVGKKQRRKHDEKSVHCKGGNNLKGRKCEANQMKKEILRKDKTNLNLINIENTDEICRWSYQEMLQIQSKEVNGLNIYSGL